MNPPPIKSAHPLAILTLVMSKLAVGEVRISAAEARALQALSPDHFPALSILELGDELVVNCMSPAQLNAHIAFLNMIPVGRA